MHSKIVRYPCITQGKPKLYKHKLSHMYHDTVFPRKLHKMYKSPNFPYFKSHSDNVLLQKSRRPCYFTMQNFSARVSLQWIHRPTLFLRRPLRGYAFQIPVHSKLTKFVTKSNRKINYKSLTTFCHLYKYFLSHSYLNYCWTSDYFSIVRSAEG